MSQLFYGWRAESCVMQGHLDFFLEHETIAAMVCGFPQNGGVHAGLVCAVIENEQTWHPTPHAACRYVELVAGRRTHSDV